MKIVMLVVMGLIGCNLVEQPELGQQSWECPIEVETGSLAVDIEGRPVRFASMTGDILERAAASRGVEQLLFDPVKNRVLGIEEGAIVAYGEDMRERETLAPAPAGTWILPSPRGVIVFDPDTGWRLLEAESIAPDAPLPIAAWFDDELHALVPSETGLDWLVSRELSAPMLRVALEARPGMRAARAATLPGAVLADEDASGVRLRLVDQGGSVHGELWLPSMGSIVDLVSLGAAARTERVAMLLADPPTVVVADLAGRRRGFSALPLDGEPAPGRALLAPTADRLLVATVTGVVAVTIEDGLSLEASFEGEGLRAPLAGPVGRRTF